MNSTAVLLALAGVLMLAGIAARHYPRVWTAFLLGGTSSALAAAIVALGNPGFWDWQPGVALSGENIHLRLDGISAFFMSLLAVIGAAAGVYSNDYWHDKRHPRSAPFARGTWSALLLCIGLVLLAANGLHFLIAWELFTLSAYFLITCDRSRSEVRKAGWLYLAASHTSTVCLFALMAALAAHSGTWEMDSWRNLAGTAPLFWLALVGFGLKAGLFPLHIWLPSAHANAPSHVSAILSGVAIKMGIYGLVRFTGLLEVPSSAGWVVVVLGVASSVLGVAFALGQHDLKRLLAYHSVENIGIIVMGIGFGMIALEHGNAEWGRLALAGGLLHVWNHGLFKALLFLGAGSVLHATGTREMSRLGGLWRMMPWTASCFVLGAAAISGLPPLNGFVSEWLLYLGLFDAASNRGATSMAAVAAAVLLAVTGALALACFAKVVGIVFLGSARSNVGERAREAGWWMRVPMLFLSVCCGAIGLAPVLVWPALAKAISAWQPAWDASIPKPLATIGAIHVMLALTASVVAVLVFARMRSIGVTRSVTWDCGYARPTSRMQYTAGSFAQIINGWFAWILRPETHAHPVRGFFPTGASHAEHTPETVLEKVLAPVASGFMGISSAVRRLQHGRLQSYILYLVLGLAGLAILALWEGAK